MVKTSVVGYLWRGVRPLLVAYLIMQTFVRACFIVYDFTNIKGTAGISILYTFIIGLIYDLSAFCYFLIPICLYLLLPGSKSKAVQKFSSGMFLIAFFYLLLFTSIAEFLFWEEFSSRFNFIAVDYLVYTQEVIGNIKESYPLKSILAAIAVVSAAISAYLINRGVIFKTNVNLGVRRFGFLALILTFPVLSFFITSQSLTDYINNQYLREAAKNGYFSLFSAFRNNELNYSKFYVEEDVAYASNSLRANVEESNSRYLADTGLYRHITAGQPQNKYNVMLVIVESLSASFLGSYGNKDNITPNLDNLIAKSISFSNMQAIGTRTVYGLAAISLSIPPVPGNSIVKRPGNENLFSLATIFNNNGYESKFIYGGFGYFDNMNYFFSNNGYKVIDRSLLKQNEITFSNIWGVCDEDLFMRAIREANETYKSGKPFFQTIMTTSNHRPYTYPDGKIDIPSHTGRNGGVKYTDYAIGSLIREAKKYTWFNDTIFVITADHTASSAGKIELAPDKYHIPFLIYAPKIINKPETVSTLSSQIDIAPTILGLLGFSYDSKFFGQDLFKSSKERAFISNYQKLGYLTKEGLTIIKPIKDASYYKREDGIKFTMQEKPNKEHLTEAVSYYQNAVRWKELNSK